jgi:hypothetical protein
LLITILIIVVLVILILRFIQGEPLGSTCIPRLPRAATMPSKRLSEGRLVRLPDGTRAIGLL